jgi:O-antigen ligase
MKKAFYIKDNIENKISFYHLLFFLVVLPFDRFYSIIILISFLVHTAIFFKKNDIRKITRSTFILQAVFFLTLISALYAPSFSDSSNVIVKQLAIFLFPFLFAVTSIDLAKYRSRLLLGLTLSCTFTVIYLYFDAVHVLIYNKLPLKDLMSWAFVNHNFSLPIEMHATYLSMLLVICIIFCLEQLFHYQKVSKKIYLAACSIILTAGLIQLSSKSVLFALLLILTIGFSLFVVDRGNRYRFLFISITSSVLLVSFVLSFQVFRERYITKLKDDLYGNHGIVSMNGRFDRWNIALGLIKQSPVIGTGTGSEVPLLREAYFEHKMYGPYLFSLNAHNQLLSFLINSGVIGLLIYLGVLGWGFRQSVIHRDIFLFSFIILISVVSFSEDLLDVNKGIFFYAFFFPFFFNTLKKKDSKNSVPLQPQLENNVLYSKRYHVQSESK